MTFGSLFAGIGGFDLFSFVSTNRIENNKPIFHKRNSNFFKLIMPSGMCLMVAYNEIFRRIVMFIKINMVNNFFFFKWSFSFSCCYQDMFCNITRFVSIRMRWIKNVKISIAKLSPFISLAFRFCNKNSPSLPRIIQNPRLISFCGNSGRYPHFFHGSPNYMLGRSIFIGDFLLRHSEFNVITQNIFFFERGIIGILIHGGIVSDASK